MAIYKCKMCGGELECMAAEPVGVCEYCGTRQTLPKANDEIIQNLFNRANTLRLKGEFDKAEQVYEKILQEDPTEAEAHWGIVLCKYGIEYVEDPGTYQRVPTCHRTSYDAITADTDFLAALEQADPARRLIYEAEAKTIDDIQKSILAVVKNEQPFDVFLCYKQTDEYGKRTVDSAIANEIYYQLTQEGMKVFYAAITLEEKLGREYEPYIFAALNSAKVMLVIGTKPQYFNAVWVKNEWSRFLKLMKRDRSKLLIPCYRDMDAYDLPDEFARLQAQDMSKIGFISDVVRGIKKLSAPEPVPVQPVAAPSPAKKTEQLILKDDTMYEGEVFAGVPHGYGVAKFTSGSVYEGNWDRGKRHGQGKMTWSRGGQWIGEFKEGNPVSGDGVMYLNINGKDYRYEGEYRNGARNGQGKFYFTDSVYEGQWVNGKRHGTGKIVWSKGGEWVGQYRDDGAWEGSGVMYTKKGDFSFRYEGSYRNGTRNGFGKMIYSDCTYEGQWLEGKRHGAGKTIWNKGGEWNGQYQNDGVWSGEGVMYVNVDGVSLRYEGQYDRGARNGYGKFYYTDCIYEGRWLDGKRHGMGTLIWNKGGQWTGLFRNNEGWEGEGTWHYTDARYEGPKRDGKRDGNGTIYWNKGGQWTGLFRNNEGWTGEGTWYYNDGKYEGAKREGKRNGSGTIYWNKGGQWTGTFKDGNPWNGKGTWHYSDGPKVGRFLLGKCLSL